jgi:hypothetical protein
MFYMDQRQYSLRLMLDGRISMEITFSVSMLPTKIDKWDAWVSKISSIGSPLQGLPHVINYFRQSIKRLSFDQVAVYEPATETVGAAVNMQFWEYQHWRNMVTNGIYNNNLVTFSPVSSEVTLLTQFIPSEHVFWKEHLQFNYHPHPNCRFW